MDNAEQVLDALGDPTRRLVLKRLRKGVLSVREIADGMDVSRPAVSQHLKVLRAAGLVVVRAEGFAHVARWILERNTRCFQAGGRAGSSQGKDR
jgi:DNA-binding transcriptional ArsR family regulator